MPHRQDQAPPCERIHALARLLAENAIDAAIDAGLMEVDVGLPCSHGGEDAQRVLAEQQRLLFNWAARARYRARTARLQRRAAERQAKRAPAAAVATPAATLPPAVAAALARAKARAAQRSDP